MALEKEIETYKNKLPSILGDQGKYVLIKELDIVGIYSTYDDAITVGYEKFGLEPFLVKKISADEEIHFFTRALCPT